MISLTCSSRGFSTPFTVKLGPDPERGLPQVALACVCVLIGLSPHFQTMMSGVVLVGLILLDGMNAAMPRPGLDGHLVVSSAGWTLGPAGCRGGPVRCTPGRSLGTPWGVRLQLCGQSGPLGWVWIWRCLQERHVWRRLHVELQFPRQAGSDDLE